MRSDSCAVRTSPTHRPSMVNSETCPETAVPLLTIAHRFIDVRMIGGGHRHSDQHDRASHSCHRRA